MIAALYPEPISRRYPEVAAAVGLMGEISARFSDALEKAELANLTAFGNARQEFFLHLTGELDTAQRPEEVLRTGADACVARLPGLPGWVRSRSVRGGSSFRQQQPLRRHRTRCRFSPSSSPEVLR